MIGDCFSAWMSQRRAIGTRPRVRAPGRPDNLPGVMSADRQGPRKGAWGVVAALLGLTLLFVNVAQSRRPLGAMEYQQGCGGEWFSAATWRYWDDLAGAVNRYLAQTGKVRFRDVPESAPRVYEALTRSMTAEAEIEPFEFWRTLPRRAFAREAVQWTPSTTEDAGRAWIAAVGFTVLSGVSPYLLVWLGPILAVPMMVWLCWALAARAGRPVAAFVCALLLGLSSYVAETLSLPRSAVGFHLLGIVLLSAVAVTLLCGSLLPRRRAGIHIAVAALFFALFTITRAGTGLTAAGFLLTFLLYERRFSGSPRAIAVKALGWLLLFLGPYLIVRPAEAHNIWVSVWEGLGDFGSDRGFSWHDRDAKRVLEAAGIEPFVDPKLVTQEHERFFRDRVVTATLDDPVWYAGVLARRIGSTISFAALSPNCERDGRSVEDPSSHYKYTSGADYFGLGRSRIELPSQALFLPILVWGVLALVGARRGGAGWRAQLEVGIVILLGVLPAPVLISTLSGQETQMMFVLSVYAVACLVAAVFTRSSSGAPGAPTASR